MRKYIKPMMVALSTVLVGCNSGNIPKDSIPKDVVIEMNSHTEEHVKQERVLSASVRKGYVAANSFACYGIGKDGTIKSSNSTLIIESGFGTVIAAPNISRFSNMVSIAAGFKVLCGIDKDGILVGDGADNNEGESTLAYYKDIKQITTNGNAFILVTKDGKLKTTGRTTGGSELAFLSLANDVQYVECKDGNVIYIKSDGTVRLLGDDSASLASECNTWTDIVDVSCGHGFVVGLKSDGTVVSAGENSNGQCEVAEWSDIVEVTCGGDCTVGLKADGTVVATGNDEYGQLDVEDWTDIVAIAAGSGFTVGLKKDGTLVAVGLNDDGQCEVAGIDNLMVPEYD